MTGITVIASLILIALLCKGDLGEDQVCTFLQWLRYLNLKGMLNLILMSLEFFMLEKLSMQAVLLLEKQIQHSNILHNNLLRALFFI